MTARKLLPFLYVILVSSLFSAAPPAAADSSHVRIIRLSVVQGDVRFSRATHGDPLADASAVWETASLNLPIRQGYVLATDNGRAEVEFENGALAFLRENTVLEFYDLSLEDSAHTTRLVLRQGSASFYVNSAGGDYFSVTGGDFTVEAGQRSAFRLDGFDDGSTVETYQGHVSVLHNKNTTRLEKGQSLSIKAGDDSSLTVSRLPAQDDFDQWVSGRIQSVSAATSAATQFTGSPYYAPGFADLYTYGGFSNCGSYGYGWRPFGVGYGWSPFTDGRWILDPTYGYTWASNQPWGWAPYHYGGWLFDASCGGWFYSAPFLYGFPGNGFGPGRRFPKVVHPPHPIFHSVTAVFVRQAGKMGIVPMHPLDEKGKTPLNLGHGVFSDAGVKGAAPQVLPAEPGQKWTTLKSPPREGLSTSVASTGPPAHVTRMAMEGKSGAATFENNSTIVYDPLEHRFVNSSFSAASPSTNGNEIRSENGRAPAVATSTPAAGVPSRNPAAPAPARTASSAPPARSMAPPPAPRYSGGSSASSGRSGGWGGSSASSAGSSGRASSSSSAASSAGSSHPSSGRPH